MSSEKFRNKYRIPTARLKGWDYSSDGWYFVTICTDDRVCYFGDVVDGEMGLSGVGKVAQTCWNEIPKHFPHVGLDEYIVMPNHVHGIVVINWNKSRKNGDAIVETQNFASLRIAAPNSFGPQTKNLASIIRGYKIGVQKHATMNKIPFSWQPRYHDAIIRTPESLERIRHYISKNPANWKTDRNNLEGLYM